jgi:hypothetical protein
MQGRRGVRTIPLQKRVSLNAQTSPRRTVPLGSQPIHATTHLAAKLVVDPGGLGGLGRGALSQIAARACCWVKSRVARLQAGHLKTPPDHPNLTRAELGSRPRSRC